MWRRGFRAIAFFAAVALVAWVVAKYQRFSIADALCSGEVCRVSFADLAAFPDVLDDRAIVLSGFVSLEFEGDAIYPSQEAWRAGQYADAVYIPEPNEVVMCDQRHCTLIGTFDADVRGHLGLFRGMLERIERVVPADMHEAKSSESAIE